MIGEQVKARIDGVWVTVRVLDRVCVELPDQTQRLVTHADLMPLTGVDTPGSMAAALRATHEQLDRATAMVRRLAALVDDARDHIIEAEMRRAEQGR